MDMDFWDTQTLEEPPDWWVEAPPMDEPPDLYLEDDDFILARLDQYAPPSLPAAEGFGVPAEVYEDVPLFPDDEVPLRQAAPEMAAAQHLPDWQLQHNAIIVEADREEYAVGLMEVWRDPQTGQQAGVYLPLGWEPSLEEAQARQTLLYHIAEAAEVPEPHLGDFLFSLEQGEREWQPMSDSQWALADQSLTPDVPDFMDDLQWAAKDQLLSEVFSFTEMERPAPALDDHLRSLGLQVAGIDPVSVPPPLYDETTQTAYWIGVYQPDPASDAPVITSLLALGTDETGNPTAHLAPVAAGSFDHAHQTAEYLLTVAERTGDVGRVLDAAEGMAVATQYRELWDTPQGIPVEGPLPFNPASLEL